ncbi:hypothetical protein ACWKWF_02145 [Acinetobacter kookii]
MDKYLVVAIVVIVCIFIVIYTQRADTGSASRSFKDLVQKEFNKYKVIEKNQTIMICEINHRNELDELVLIRIDPS